MREQNSFKAICAVCLMLSLLGALSFSEENTAEQQEALRMWAYRQKQYDDAMSSKDEAAQRSMLEGFFKEDILKGELAWGPLVNFISFQTINNAKDLRDERVSRLKCSRIISAYKWGLEKLKVQAGNNDLDLSVVSAYLCKFCADNGSWDTNFGVGIDEALKLVKENLEFQEGLGHPAKYAASRGYYVQIYVKYLSNTESARRAEFYHELMDVRKDLPDWRQNAEEYFQILELACEPVLYDLESPESSKAIINCIGEYDSSVRAANVDFDRAYQLLNDFYRRRLESFTNACPMEILKFIAGKRVNLIEEYAIKPIDNKDGLMFAWEMQTYSFVGDAIGKRKGTPNWRIEAIDYYEKSIESAKKFDGLLAIAQCNKKIADICKNDDEDISDHWNRAIKGYAEAIKFYEKLKSRSPEFSYNHELQFCYSELGYSYLSRNKVFQDRLPAIECYQNSQKINEEDKQNPDYKGSKGANYHQLGFCYYILFKDLKNTVEALRYFDLAIQIRTELNDKQGLANSQKRKALALVKRDALLGSISAQAVAGLAEARKQLLEAGYKEKQVAEFVCECMGTYCNSKTFNASNQNRDVIDRLDSLVDEFLKDGVNGDKNYHVVLRSMSLKFKYDYGKTAELADRIARLKKEVDDGDYVPGAKAIVKSLLEGIGNGTDKY